MSVPKGYKHSEESRRKMSLKAKGRKHSEWTKKKLSLTKMGNKNGFKKGHKPWNTGKGHLFKGEKNRMWKGEDANYKSIHEWINTNYGKPEKCERCECKENLDWCNKDHQYRRVREDWLVLCKKCHRVFDKRNNGWRRRTLGEIIKSKVCNCGRNKNSGSKTCKECKFKKFGWMGENAID